MKKQKKNLIRIISAFVIFIIGLLLPADEEVKLVIFLAAFAIAGLDVVLRALRNITRGQVFDENFLMSIATIGAFFVGEYPEAAAVMLFYQTGELFASYAVAQSRKSIAELMDIRPEYANVLREGGTLTVSPEEVVPGELILIKPGERIPLDGEVVKGNSTADTSALTGESMPRELSQGSTVISGCINLNGILTVKVSKGYEECTVAKILELVENAGSRKAVAEKFITKFAKYYTPIVVIIALLLALVPPLFISGEEFSGWIYRALIFLVVSCPCALVISIPLGFFGGIGGASRRGILVKGSNYLEALAAAEIVVFDKTGTLTKGNFVLTGIYPEGINQEELLELTAKAEVYSNHPISLSIKKAYGKEIFEGSISQTEEIPGYGMMAVVDGMRVYAGNERLMKSKRISYKANNDTGTVVYVALDGIFIGSLTISDEIKADAPLAIQGLKEAGIRKTVILTGDAQSIGVKVAGELGVDEVYAELLPADKVKRMEELFREKSEEGKLVFVGDGINDAPVLARADIGIAMGGLGSDAAIEAADIVIMTDEPSKIKDAIDISKRTLRIVKQNIVFALGVKAAVLLLGAAGMADMWEAVFADVGVSVIAILNSIRILKRN